MAELETLLQLQSIDSELDQAASRIDTLRHSLGETAELKGARAAVEADKKRVELAEKRQREMEWDVNDRSSKIGQLDKKLYSGTVTSPKDLSGLQTEIQHMRETLSAVEDKALEAMSEAEDARKSLAVHEAALAAAEKEWAASQSALKAEGRALTANVAVLKPKRESVAAMASKPSLARYEELRRQKHGLAVARVERNMCLGCRTDVPTARVQQSRHGEMVFCPSCGRILYVGH